jgi:dihydropteroate synthase
MLLRARQFEFRFPGRALVMGIVNVTPDSFYDGGRYLDAGAARDHALELVEAGADIIDVGGESTRPGAEEVEEGEERRRVLPVIEMLAGVVGVPISVDTRKPGIAREAVALGASIVNDVGASREEEAMGRMIAETGAGYVCMHMQGSPRTMQTKPMYQDVTREVDAFFGDRIKRLGDCGVLKEQLILDPGIGFGKTVEHNLRLLAELESFKRFERPILVGVSRKSFLQKTVGGETDGRLAASIACVCHAVEAGAAMVRVHDVTETVQAIRMTEAILARKR